MNKNRMRGQRQGEPVAGLVTTEVEQLLQVARKLFDFHAVDPRTPLAWAAKRGIAPKALLCCKRKIRELTRRKRGISRKRMVRELAAYLRGWKSYFAFCETPSVLKSLDQWMRRRLRSVWKQGKRRSLWRMANSPVLTTAYPVAYFDSLGLPRWLAGQLNSSEPP